jgi:hypothetical protein
MDREIVEQLRSGRPEGVEMGMETLMNKTRPVRGIRGVGPGFVLALVFCGCAAGASQEPATQPATASTTAPAPFTCAKFSFTVQPPADWTAVKGDPDDALSLVPQSQASAKDLSKVPSLKITVPDLPIHIPGMIPVGSVANGYVSDTLKQYPDFHVDERVVATVPAANARRIVSTFSQNGATWRDMVLCIVHKDRVFLLVADCPVGDYPATRAAFDAMTGSLKWN